MAENEAGMIFTQSGVPVREAADYQKVLDSRWRFMEVALEASVTINLPAVAAVGSFSQAYWEHTAIATHALGFLPAWETSIEIPEFPNDFELFADERDIIIRRMVDTNGLPAQTVSGRVRVYNLPVLEDYEAPKQFPQGSTSPESPIGVKFLDGSAPVDVGDVSPVGFSIDTTKKILSIHKHGLFHANPWVGQIAKITAIDTPTDVVTLAQFDANSDFTWVGTLGQAIQLSPNDFVTWPAPLTAGQTVYLIPMTSTTAKLANSRADALAGIAINLTSTGSLPHQISATEDPGNPQNRIEHGVGYPPTFILSQVDPVRTAHPAITKQRIGPMLENLAARVTADNQYVSFFGVQAVFSGQFGFIILKDPAEIAR